MTQTATFDIFSAIGNPRRRQILSLLANKEYGVVELADKLGISQPSVSEQLGSLKRAGLVTSSAKGRRRIYHLDTAPLGEVASWVIEINKFWDERFARLSQLVEELDKEER
jgi:predicted transcriptional regulator